MKKIAIIVAVLLLVGCLPLLGWYYTLLRILVTIGGVVIIIGNRHEGMCWENIVLGIMVILFNPLFPIYLYEKFMWVILDVLCGGFFLYVGFKKFK